MHNEKYHDRDHPQIEHPPATKRGVYASHIRSWSRTDTYLWHRYAVIVPSTPGRYTTDLLTLITTVSGTIIRCAPLRYTLDVPGVSREASGNGQLLQGEGALYRLTPVPAAHSLLRAVVVTASAARAAESEWLQDDSNDRGAPVYYRLCAAREAYSLACMDASGVGEL